ncbi:MAG: CsbD family protein [Ardenticatenales bacterium]
MSAASVKAKSKQLDGQVKTAFDKLTGDDLMAAEGDAMKLVGSIQARYGYTRAQAQRAWDSFTSSVGDAEEGVVETAHGVGDKARQAWDTVSTGVEDAAHVAAGKAHDVGDRIDEVTAPYRPSGRHAGLKTVAVLAALVAAVVIGRWVVMSCGVLLGGASPSGTKRSAAARR